jgi:hypothetical protein
LVIVALIGTSVAASLMYPAPKGGHEIAHGDKPRPPA